MKLTRASFNASATLMGALFALAAALACGATSAADFAVSPLTVVFENNVRSGQITVRNEGKAEVRFELHAKDWTQDASGADQYADSDSLIYFPRSMAIPPGEQRIIRVGIKAPPADIEQAFRLFIEELPGKPAAGASGMSNAQLQILLNVGVPVFARPPRAAPRGEIEGLSLDLGKIRLVVHNTGNEHFKATSIDIVGIGKDGQEKFRRTIEDRYFLAGTTKSYSEAIPADVCAELATLEATVVTEQTKTGRKLDVPGSGCR